MKRFIVPITFVLSTVVFLGIGCEKPNSQPVANSNTTEPVVDITDTLYEEEESIEVVTADVYGKDLDLIERYPGSWRSYYSSNEYETDVTYQTADSTDAVRSYYDETLQAAGWTNSEQATDYMEYLKGDDINPEIITLYLTEYPSQNLVEYELVYEPPLTDEQLDELSAETTDEFEL